MPAPTLCAPRFPPEGHSVSSEALYRGREPRLKRCAPAPASGTSLDSERLSPSGPWAGGGRGGGRRPRVSPPARGAARAGPGRSSGAGGRGSRACSEGPAEARGREGREGSAALPPRLAGKRWRRSGERGDSAAPPPSGSAACCCSGAGRRAPWPPRAALRRSPQDPVFEHSLHFIFWWNQRIHSQ